MLLQPQASCALLEKPPDLVLLLSLAPVVRRNPPRPVSDVNEPFLVGKPEAPAFEPQLVAHVSGQGADHERHISVLPVDRIDVSLVEQRVHAVDLELVQERESIATEVVFVLEEGDLVAVPAVLGEVAPKILIEVIRSGAEQRVVEDHGAESKPAQALREAESRIQLPDGE